MHIDLSNPKTKKDFSEWLSYHLVSKEIGAQITGQTTNAFNQSVKLGQITPFYETDGKGPAKIKLYLREELEKYAQTKRTYHSK
ncbi:hypothetical protein NGG16_17925 [Enterococcus casseliflavus]|uniref:hypothetical protein n=1 Tax=Enterococcus casseliflavus TaxID=37734 RepID=UPI002DBF1488|nr:hypothetical protein [Enterococcus casseliflavus]MEB8419310.1 hypothetical protein [Enterococcus casseliflavus]